MSHRKTTIEEEFDDDTDLPLPSRPLPNTGTRGALLQEVDDDEYDIPTGTDSTQAQPGPASLLRPPTAASSAGAGGANTVTDITPYKKWTCIYPIYIDAKRAYGTGERRISREKSIWWPLSKDIADACSRLGLGTLHEVQKCHPRDWENPGRVRVQWRKDGKLVNSAIASKKQLLEMISFQIQRTKPDNIPKKPFLTSRDPNIPSEPVSATPSAAPSAQTPSNASSNTKGKQPAKGKPGSALTVASATPSSTQDDYVQKARLPRPPAPLPSLASRVSPYSPALPSGVLIETVKAGMNAQAEGGGAGGMGGMGASKGKKKVIRVRG
ncbi:signal recognition particle SRP19 subunit [Coniophora puteana RWD-64-598 SS2]|uniref:Signal recognition particle SRP19 subunit n=1 Tax=Coniophora puteana (strain RWD-64-598) TaxID=741705 RepID=A0A5M3MDS2_CONPW|nr:signal recognition particle SRP19 subunit [Coniophora puteana RWD-64-598 SS2]EIW77030.1 signal recognition particle SRP19 subunit [Coniophora puteana RWD-64-598 SS2]